MWYSISIFGMNGVKTFLNKLSLNGVKLDSIKITCRGRVSVTYDIFFYHTEEIKE